MDDPKRRRGECCANCAKGFRGGGKIVMCLSAQVNVMYYAWCIMYKRQEKK